MSDDGRWEQSEIEALRVGLENARDELKRYGSVYARLTEVVDHHFGPRSTMPLEALVDVLEKELGPLVTQIREDALIEAVEQCESERRACEVLCRRFPKNNVHATGVLIANVCARRVRSLLGEDNAYEDDPVMTPDPTTKEEAKT